MVIKLKEKKDDEISKRYEKEAHFRKVASSLYDIFKKLSHSELNDVLLCAFILLEQHEEEGGLEKFINFVNHFLKGENNNE